MHKTMRSLLFLFVVLGSTLMVGCGSSVPVIKPFRLDIQQGNVVTSKMLLQLRPGMTKSQVKFIMGTPLVVDSFHTNRWDYFYQLRQAGKIVEQRRVILDFEKELLARVRGDVVPQGTAGADTGVVALANESKATSKPEVKEGLLENLQFWKNNQSKAVEQANQPADTKPKPAEKGLLDKLKFWEKDTPVAESKAAVAVEASKSAKDSLPAAELPTATAAAIVAPAIVDASPDASVVEAPSMLAVPIEIAPAETATAVVPAQTTPSQPTATVEVPKQMVTDAPMPEPTPTEPMSAAVNREERFIFRLDRNIDVKNLQKAQVTPAETATAVKAKVLEQKVVPAEDPGYFERMLEKIGF